MENAFPHGGTPDPKGRASGCAQPMLRIGRGPAAFACEVTTTLTLGVVVEASMLRGEDLGAFLRREGLHQAHLDEWTKAITAALSDETHTKGKRSKRSPETKRIAELERDLRRKNAALAETGALLALSKKARALWGDADDDTPAPSAS